MHANNVLTLCCHVKKTCVYSRRPRSRTACASSAHDNVHTCMYIYIYIYIYIFTYIYIYIYIYNN